MGVRVPAGCAACVRACVRASECVAINTGAQMLVEFDCDA